MGKATMTSSVQRKNSAPVDFDAIESDATDVIPDMPETTSVEVYQETLLSAATKAASLLDELMGLSVIPDSRVKDAADIALRLVELTNAQLRAEAALE